LPKKKVILIGAGLLGLRTADLLSQKGYEVELIESSPTTGGLTGTFNRTIQGKDFYFDYGPHLLFEEFKNDYHELIGDALRSITGKFAIIVEGKTLSYPLKITEIFKNIPLRMIIPAVTEILFQSMLKSRAEVKSLEHWMTSRFGKIIFQRFYAPYVEKCNGLKSEEVAVDWATERAHVTGNSLIEVFWNRLVTALRDKSGAPNLPSSNQICAYYPDKGVGEITKALTNRIMSNNGIIHLNSGLSEVTLENNSVRGISITTGGKFNYLEADHYISTIPLPLLIRGITPVVSPALLEAAANLKYRHLILMYLIINQPRVIDAIEIFFSDPDVIFKRIYEPKSLSEWMAPADKTSLCLEISCNEGDNFDEEELFKKAINNLNKAGIVSPNKIIHSFTIRMPYAYPIYTLKFKKNVDLLLEYLGRINNLISVGRQGTFKYHAMTNETMALSAELADIFDKID
jgi:protoporphyrinogen oxidase